MNDENKRILRNFAINWAAKLLLDGQFWADVKMFVRDAARTDLSNEEKHEHVKKNLIIIFGNLGNTLLDWAIKFGVLWLKSLKGYEESETNN